MRWAGRVLWGAGETLVTLGIVVLLLVRTNCGGRTCWRSGPPGGRCGNWNGCGARLRAGEAAGVAGALEPTGSGGADAADTADGEADTSEESAGVSEVLGGGAYAVLRIPRLGVTVPVAQGTGKAAVLDRGHAGHHPRTAQPGQAGNFAVAGHRNTHCEPFPRLDQLRTGRRPRHRGADDGRGEVRTAAVLRQPGGCRRPSAAVFYFATSTTWTGAERALLTVRWMGGVLRGRRRDRRIGPEIR